jgi:NAD(P)-dependent dehydrogenase (short-subunit alcohol dehydrogenase family)
MRMNPCDETTKADSLDNRVVLVTGGAQGIGRAIAKRFQESGAQVCLVDCDDAMGARTAEELTVARPSRPVVFVEADLADSRAVIEVARGVGSRYGCVDVLVNNAGIEIERSFEETTPEVWDRVLRVNLYAPLLLTQALLPWFPQEGGAVVNISSIHATHAFPGSTSYACSKAGLVALTRNMALELAPRGIRANVVCPGYIDTRLWDEYLRHAADAAALEEETARLHPLGRRGVPDDVATAALFLASDASRFITGTQLVVDGGLTIRAHP